ncbi:hypothetical protein lbkm_3076 [Lachnospiraceae bacterium KM106-2]|nr:hypothetical protein lbkm_3076 [Lachnospiraceae bacterium KM106-2]
MNKEINISVKMRTKDMFDFLFRHAYTNLSGILGVILSACAFVYLILNYQELSTAKIALLIFGSLLFTVINPIQLYMKAAQQVKLNPAFKDALVYRITEEAVNVKQGGQKGDIKWDEIIKVIETKKSILIYTSNVTAFILPKASMEGQEAALRDLIKQKIDAKKCKLKTA